MRHPQRLREIVEHGLCIGCGLCQSIAGPERVRMDWVDPPGRLRPRIIVPLDDDTERLILETCPGVRLDEAIDPVRHAGARVDACFGPWIRVWKGHASDPEIHHMASSGGGLSALGVYLIESGEVDFVLHVRASREKPMRTERQLSYNRADVLEGAGSRYGPSAPLIDLTEQLAKGRPFAVIGKPCDVSAVHNLRRVDRRVNELVRYTLTFSCGTFADLQCSRWMLKRQGVPGGEENLSLFRYRGYGCPGPTRAVTKDGTVYDEPYLEFWYGPHGWTHQFRCKICADPSGEMADITVADAWPGGMPAGEEWGGYCLFASRTPAGDALMQRAIDANVLTAQASDIDAFHDSQPHQVIKKQGLKARLRAIEDSGALGPVFENLRLDEAAAERDAVFHGRNYDGAMTRIKQGVNREKAP